MCRWVGDKNLVRVSGHNLVTTGLALIISYAKQVPGTLYVGQAGGGGGGGDTECAPKSR